MIPTSRCTIYSDTFIGACLFSALRNTQWQRRAVAVDHAWCCAPRKKKEEEEEEEESGRDALAGGRGGGETAITGDENERG